MARAIPLAALLLFGLAGVCRGEEPTADDTSPPAADASEKRLDLTLRLGQGGFSDGRSPIGKLGGGQLALDVKPRRLPIAVSLTGEYYTNGPDPTHSYEIAGLTAVNLLLVRSLGASQRAHVFLGGGLGTLAVPRDDEGAPDDMARGMVFDIEGGIRFRLYRAFGVYGIGKYLHARKTVGARRLIDFDEGIVLLGLCVELSL